MQNQLARTHSNRPWPVGPVRRATPEVMQGETYFWQTNHTSTFIIKVKVLLIHKILHQEEMYTFLYTDK